MELLIFLLGVITAIVGYIFSNFLLKPIRDYYDIRSKIGYKLTYYSHIITSPGGNGKLAEEAYSVLRDLACDLERRYLAVPFRHMAAAFRAIPREATISDAKGNILLISSSLGKAGRTDENHIALGEVFKKLGIEELSNGMIVKSAEIYSGTID